MTAQSVTGIGPGDSGKRIAYLTEISEPLQFLTTTSNAQDLITGVPPSGGGGGGTGFLANNFFVAKNGNDSTGDGSISKPFLTVQAGINAASAVASVSPTIIRPSVFVMPGTYNENITLKANVMVRGMENTSTRIIGTVVVDSTFTPAGDWRSGFADLYISGNVNIDFNAVSSNEGKIFTFNTRYGGNITLTAFSNINQFIFYTGEFFGTMTINGFQTVLDNVIAEGGSIILNGVAAGQNYLLTAGGNLGNITISQVASNTHPTTCIFGHNVQNGATLTIDGTFPSINAGINSIPVESLISLTNSASLSQLANINDANLYTSPNAIATVTSNYTIGSTEEVLFVNTSSGAVNLTLPNPKFYRKFKIKDIGGNTLTNPINVVAFGSENIEGAASPYVISSSFFPVVELQSDGTNWWVM